MRCERCNSCCSQWDMRNCLNCNHPGAEIRPKLVIIAQLCDIIRDEVAGAMCEDEVVPVIDNIMEVLNGSNSK